MATTSLAFPHGQLYQTRRIADTACEHPPFTSFIASCISRHLSCDWGDCCPDDAALNNASLRDGGRLFSVYNIPSGLYDSESKIWIITEHDRSYTTVLFPSDY